MTYCNKTPAALKGDQAYDVWKTALGDYDGEFYETERGAMAFKGKSDKGEFAIYFVANSPYATVCADLHKDSFGAGSKSGYGTQCKTFADVREATKEAAEFCGAKRKEFEQLKLW